MSGCYVLEEGIKPHNASEALLGMGIDLEYETDVAPTAPEPAFYETAYVTSHKGNCRAGAFSADGQLCATGSMDASIKVIGKYSHSSEPCYSCLIHSMMRFLLSSHCHIVTGE